MHTNYDNYNTPRASITTKPPSFSEEQWHAARCVGLVELGEIFIVTKWQKQVRLTFELPFELRHYDDDKSVRRPKLISKEYASSLYGKSWLKKHLTKWLGQAFVETLANGIDPYELVGEPCQLLIQHKQSAAGKWYEDIEDIASLLEGVPEQVNKSTVLTFNAWDQDVFDPLPAYVKNKIIGSKEFIAKFGKVPPFQEKSNRPSDPPPF